MASELSPLVDAARVLNDALQLVNVLLVQVNARYLAQGGPPPFAINVDLAPVQWTRREDQIHGVFQIRALVGHPTSELAAEPFAEITVAYQCVYRIMRDLTNADSAAVPAFLATVGWVHAWPYLRASTQELSTKMGLPPLVLPMLLPGQAENIPVLSQEDLQRLSANGDPTAKAAPTE